MMYHNFVSCHDESRKNKNKRERNVSTAQNIPQVHTRVHVHMSCILKGKNCERRANNYLSLLVQNSCYVYMYVHMYCAYHA
jgi:hypothetical protein